MTGLSASIIRAPMFIDNLWGDVESIKIEKHVLRVEKDECHTAGDTEMRLHTHTR